VLLAIDTATSMMGLALHDGRDLTAESHWRTAQNHSVELAPAVIAMLSQAGLQPRDLSAIAVCTGPGSYTGVRIGVALAKGLASARGIPLVGVGALDALAAGQPYFQGGLIAVVSAGRGRIIAGAYHWRGGRWKVRRSPELMTWAALLASVDGPACITGEIDDAGHEAAAAARAEGAPIMLMRAGFRLRRAGFLADEAWARLRESQRVLREEFAPAHVQPIYVKTKDVPA
jgi:tRNA threonylcarbamoyladenosine biosynthesis protein TsaB